MILPPSDPRIGWQGIVSLEVTPDWVKPWRLPHDQAPLFPPVGLMERAGMPAGVRIVFSSDTTRVGGAILPYPDMSPVDLVVNGELVGTHPLDNAERFLFDGLAPEMKRIELWLPQFGDFRLIHLELSEGAKVEPIQEERFRWITYGSSITQCRTAASPTQTWPAIVARARNWDLLCLGFGGQCHLDPMVARLIRDQRADFVSMCVGINIYGGSSLNARTFRPAIIGAVQIIREKHPEIPIVLMSPILSPPREETPNAVGMTLRMMRHEVAEAALALQMAGDENVHYVDGLDILGPEHAHLLPDELHPDAEGYRVMGQHFLERVVQRLFPEKNQPY